MLDYYQTQKDEERTRKKRKFRLFFAGFFLVLVILGIFLICKTAVFQIKDIEIQGNQLVENESILEIINKELGELSWPLNWIFVKDSSIFLTLKREEILQKIENDNPPMETINLKIDYFKKKVSISLVEREKFALWCQESVACWWFDKEGVVFIEGPATEGELIPKIVDYSGIEIAEGKSIVADKEYVRNIVLIFDFLEKTEISARTLELRDLTLAEMTTVSDNFPKIYFSLRHSPFFASEAISQIKDKLSKIEYIDLTVENRVYYKEK
ncbi:MAG: hypothetical protein UW08_C0006G0002 [Parcubacteria group bacterium GW2011_GWB1_43_8b]|nr:MAG: hypothetical protein UW08_C0006G0002 [Parcubacteria group bacterium GW2011_GWB1_43_8b]